MTSRKVVRKAFEACLSAVEPRPIVRDAISVSLDTIRIGGASFPRGKSTSLVVIGFGKASILMARGALDRLTAPLLQKTIVIAPEHQKTSTSEAGMEVHFGARNNLPDVDSVMATGKVIAEIEQLDSEDTIFVFLISGGGSALLCSPKPPLSLQDKLATIKTMQSAGATIQELNVVRQKMSEVKGGKLLGHVKKGRSVALLISDVIGDPIDLIASGPTVIPASSSAIAVLSGLKIDLKELPASVQSVLKSSEEETHSTLRNTAQNFIISSNKIALRAASESLTSSGFHTRIVTSSLSGNASRIGRQFADLISSESFRNSELLNIQEPLEYPIALLFGGETTVQLAEKPGKGGRNQEMVLACFDALKTRTPAHRFIFMSAGSDGQDGPTDAAGAIISNSDLLIPSPMSSESLASSDSYNFWRDFNNGSNHLLTGPSGTNVMDVQILLLDKL